MDNEVIRRRTMPEHVARKQDAIVRRAVRGAVVADVRPIERQARAKRKNSPGDLTLGQAVVRALAFLALLCIPGTVLLLALINQASEINMKAVLGGAALLVIVCLFAANRTNHSGACPGVAVHCHGCKR